MIDIFTDGGFSPEKRDARGRKEPAKGRWAWIAVHHHRPICENRGCGLNFRDIQQLEIMAVIDVLWTFQRVPVMLIIYTDCKIITNHENSNRTDREWMILKRLLLLNPGVEIRWIESHQKIKDPFTFYQNEADRLASMRNGKWDYCRCDLCGTKFSIRHRMGHKPPEICSKCQSLKDKELRILYG